jgi:hypothetical protein
VGAFVPNNKTRIIIRKDTDHSKNWNGVNKTQRRQVAKIERCVKVRVKMSLRTPWGHIKVVSGINSFESRGRSSRYPLKRGLAVPQS